MSPFDFNITEKDDYTPQPFIQTITISRMHDTNRFGHTNDIIAVMEGEEERKNYVVGVIAMSIFILSIFAVWTIVLIVLKCLGKRVGCASGMPAKPPPAIVSAARDEKYEDEPQAQEVVDIKDEQGAVDVKDEQAVDVKDDLEEVDVKDDLEEVDVKDELEEVNLKDEVEAMNSKDKEEMEEQWKNQVKHAKRNILISRIVFLLCGIGNIVATIIFVNEGVNSILVSFYQTQDTLNLVDDTILKLAEVSGAFVNATSGVDQGSDKIETAESTFCPGQPVIPFRDEINAVLDLLSNLKRAIVNEVANFRNDILGLMEVTEEVRTKINETDWVFQVAIGIACVQLIITIVMVLGVLLAWIQRYPKPFRCIHSYAILPFFVLMTFLSCLFSCIFICTAVVGSDFCNGSPDDKVIIMLENIGDFDSITLSVLEFYIKGCINKPAIVSEVSSFLPLVVQAVQGVHNFTEAVAEYDPVLLKRLCGEDGTILMRAANFTHDLLHGIAVAVAGTRRLLFCSNFHPIYATLVYDAICYNGVNGFARICWSQLAIAVCSMMMVTLRVSWQQVEEMQ